MAAGESNLVAFPGNPRPRKRRMNDAEVLVLPVVRIERYDVDAIEPLGSDQVRNLVQDLVDKFGAAPVYVGIDLAEGPDRSVEMHAWFNEAGSLQFEYVENDGPLQHDLPPGL